MSLPECTVPTNNVQNLADSPTQSAQDLKKVFDQAGEDIKNYINDKLIPEIEKSDKETEDNTKKLIIKTYKYNVTTLADITETEDYTIPSTYNVNTHGLDVYFEGSLLALNENYQERGTGTSDKIRFNFTVPKDSLLTFVIRK
jgi:hypothetical protein|uniref:Uncharacterized protein n=1 Tax=Myoviridae sp. cthRr4 TaxID=2825152 RepID=A0A8S5NTM3_9CAUD|nr:MAG TPA: hypothetical protein [Myoviridae sp. cthRr4]